MKVNRSKLGITGIKSVNRYIRFRIRTVTQRKPFVLRHLTRVNKNLVDKKLLATIQHRGFAKESVWRTAGSYTSRSHVLIAPCNTGDLPYAFDAHRKHFNLFSDAQTLQIKVALHHARTVFKLSVFGHFKKVIKKLECAVHRVNFADHSPKPAGVTRLYVNAIRPQNALHQGTEYDDLRGVLNVLVRTVFYPGVLRIHQLVLHHKPVVFV